MRTSQELVERWKAAVAGRPPAAEQEHVPVSGKRYRDERGRMVTVVRDSRSRVVFHREGYRGTCELSRREFERKFTEAGEKS
ncbi:DUF4222 domain-containing protein [Enterobacter hormaechei]|uniref:DUF4222 domain-containing protein n=1 Tax=Enterobacter hormaechei TaxID=158836 RepID=UPI002A75C0F0|nr:DUF4222 domain-containing protein [Enterobacter hormaechei]MDY3570245.1 DUF4222 domain-containing protein [Enterobacter hormaechei]